MDSLEDKPGPEGAWGRSDSQAQGTKEHAGFVWEGETDLEKEHFLSGGVTPREAAGFRRGGQAVGLHPGLESGGSLGHIPCQSSPGGQSLSTHSRGCPWGWWRRCLFSPAASRGSTRPELVGGRERGVSGSIGVGKGRGQLQSRHQPSSDPPQPQEDKGRVRSVKSLQATQGPRESERRGVVRGNGGQVILCLPCHSLEVPSSL